MPDRMPANKTGYCQKNIKNGRLIQDGRQNVRRPLHFLTFDII